MDSLTVVIESLESAFSKLNTKWFNDELEKVIITCSPDNTKGAYGWFTTWKAWENSDKQGFYEINISADYMNRPVTDVIGTLLHEMVHLFNAQKGIKDVSRGNTYHNKNFKESAFNHGLIVSQTSKSGWSTTTLTDEMIEWVEEQNFEFGLVRPSTKQTANKKKSSSRKYVCPICGMSIRATKEVNIMCMDCEEPMVSEN